MRRERGVAAITAVLIVAVAASAATLMLAQHSATLDQTLLVTSRAQAEQYAQAGVEWARGILAEDARTNAAVDSLNEAWAQPIAGLPVERAVVAGAIERLAWAGVDVAPRDEPVAVPVLKQVAALDFRFLDPRGEWRASWGLPGTAEMAPPAAVEVTLQLASGERIVRLVDLPGPR